MVRSEYLNLNEFGIEPNHASELKKPIYNFYAVCHECNFRLTHDDTRAPVRKYVKKSETWCRDCGSALVWKKEILN